MIDPNTFITYAQNREDLIIAAILDGVKDGFYVDVGANHPEIDSVTKYFYDRGWSGINIEPIQKLHKLFETQRKRDININCGVGSKSSTLKLREYKGMEGRSTFSDTEKQDFAPLTEYKEYPVKIRTLKSILDEAKPAKIHFLKVDVEGFEFEVLEGNDWQKYRPEVICLEANRSDEKSKMLLLKQGYKDFFFDGLNEYFLASESLSRLGRFSFSKNVVEKSYYALRFHHYNAWNQDVKLLTSQESQINDLLKQNQNLESIIQTTQNELHTVANLSLKDKPLRQRLKIISKGITVDWLRFKKQNRSK